MPSSSTIFDTDTKLMLHMDDAGLTDSSASPKAVTLNGNAARSNTQSKFGGYSAVLDGSGDFLSFADSSDWDIGTQDFTFDFWVWFVAIASGVARFFEFGDVDASKGIACRLDGGQVYIAHNGGSPVSYGWSPSTGQWYHFEVTRASNTERVFVDGTQIGSDQAVSTDIDAGTAGGFIGSWGGAYTSFQLNGYLDEFRYVLGTAIHVANFTPPSEAYTPPLSGSFFLMF